MDVKNLDKKLLYKAIKDGVSDAIWKIANNATDAPCADFYKAIQDGAKKAMSDELDVRWEMETKT